MNEDKLVSELTAATSLADTTLWVVDQLGVTKTATGTVMKTYLQPLNSTLTSMAAIAQGGICCFSGAGSVYSRVLGGGTNQITITNGDGVSSNPSVSLANAADMPTTSSGGFSCFLRSGTWDVLSWSGTHVIIGAPRTSQWAAVRFYSAGIEAMRLDNANTPNLLIGTAGPAGTSMTGGIVHKTGGVPSTDVSNSYQWYSTTVGGVAAPHFRLSDGTVIKIHRPNSYTVTNSVPDRTYDANATTTAELAQVVAAIIADLKTIGLFG